MNEKAIYTQKAPFRGNAGASMAAFILLALGLIILLVLVSFMPYSGVLTIVVFALGAYLINKLMNKTVFDITYTIYEDRLVFVRKYGRLSWECEVFPFGEAKFFEGKIEHRGKTYAFYPDDKLKELLNI